MAKYSSVLIESASEARLEESELKPSQVLGSYRIIERIARGGMGTVYRGEHVRLGRKVAIKVLRPDRVDTPEAVKRFLAEARAVNEIGHPNIVDIADFVEDHKSTPPTVYTVMELLDGQDLADRLEERHHLSVDQAVKIAIQVSDALIATHQVHILHRDLKPANIFLARASRGDESVKLLDFGVAKTFGDRPGLDLTDPGTSVGTPLFMAPEQVLGRELDARTDIYALGIVLYQMLCGHTPFDSDQYGEILVAQVKNPPPKLSDLVPEEVVIPARLEQIVMRCLKKDRACRFQSMSELRDALFGFSTSHVREPVTEPLELEDLQQVPRFRWRKRAMFGAGVLGMLVAFLAIITNMSGPNVTRKAAATSAAHNERAAEVGQQETSSSGGLRQTEPQPGKAFGGITAPAVVVPVAQAPPAQRRQGVSNSPLSSKLAATPAALSSRVDAAKRHGRRSAAKQKAEQTAQVDSNPRPISRRQPHVRKRRLSAPSEVQIEATVDPFAE